MDSSGDSNGTKKSVPSLWRNAAKLALQSMQIGVPSTSRSVMVMRQMISSNENIDPRKLYDSILEQHGSEKLCDSGESVIELLISDMYKGEGLLKYQKENFEFARRSGIVKVFDIVKGLSEVIDLDGDVTQRLMEIGRRENIQIHDEGLNEKSIIRENVLHVGVSYRHVNKWNNGGTIDLDTATRIYDVLRQITSFRKQVKVRFWIDQILSCRSKATGSEWCRVGLAPYCTFRIVSGIENVEERKSRPWIWLEMMFALQGNGIFTVDNESWRSFNKEKEFNKLTKLRGGGWNIGGRGRSFSALYRYTLQLLGTVDSNMFMFQNYDYKTELDAYASWARKERVSIEGRIPPLLEEIRGMKSSDSIIEFEFCRILLSNSKRISGSRQKIPKKEFEDMKIPRRVSDFMTAEVLIGSRGKTIELFQIGFVNRYQNRIELLSSSGYGLVIEIQSRRETEAAERFEITLQEKEVNIYSILSSVSIRLKKEAFKRNADGSFAKSIFSGFRFVQLDEPEVNVPTNRNYPGYIESAKIAAELSKKIVKYITWDGISEQVVDFKGFLITFSKLVTVISLRRLDQYIRILQFSKRIDPHHLSNNYVGPIDHEERKISKYVTRVSEAIDSEYNKNCGVAENWHLFLSFQSETMKYIFVQTPERLIVYSASNSSAEIKYSSFRASCNIGPMDDEGENLARHLLGVNNTLQKIPSAGVFFGHKKPPIIGNAEHPKFGKNVIKFCSSCNNYINILTGKIIHIKKLTATTAYCTRIGSHHSCERWIASSIKEEQIF